MKLTYTDRIISRLEQLFNELANTTISSIDFHDRLREFKNYCDKTSALANCLTQLPPTPYDLDDNSLRRKWPNGEKGYATRWDAINQIVNIDPYDFIHYCNNLGRAPKAHTAIIERFVYPLFNYINDQLQATNIMLYILLRYKRWAEWFEAERLQTIYETQNENGLDRNLRQFLFESGIDYPFSQPRSPGGQADIVAGLETDDPLVLEVKIWDSKKNYKVQKVRDGLRQVMDYATKYGKDKGYIVVFNFDTEPLKFVSPITTDEWPPRLEHSNRIYYFIDVHISKKLKPISQQGRGKPVKTNPIQLLELLEKLNN